MTASSLSALVHGVIAAADVGGIGQVKDVFGLGAIQPLVEGDLALVTSPVPRAIDLAALFADQQQLARVALAHHEILAEICAVVDIVPIRLGGVIAGACSATAMLRDGGPRFRTTLSLIAGAVEFAVTMTDAGAPPPATVKASDGRSYLKGRAAVAAELHARPQRVKATVRAVAAMLREGARTQGERPLPPQELGVLQRHFDAAYLVERSKVPAFLARCEAAPELLAGDRLLLGVRGPWPSYSLTGELESLA
jgi:hypothetical protein